MCSLTTFKLGPFTLKETQTVSAMLFVSFDTKKTTLETLQWSNDQV